MNSEMEVSDLTPLSLSDAWVHLDVQKFTALPGLPVYLEQSVPGSGNVIRLINRILVKRVCGMTSKENSGIGIIIYS